MCQWYANQFACGHVTYAFGKFCPSSALLQTACDKKNIWQFFLVEELCNDCKAAELRQRGRRQDRYDSDTGSPKGKQPKGKVSTAKGTTAKNTK